MPLNDLFFVYNFELRRFRSSGAAEALFLRGFFGASNDARLGVTPFLLIIASLYARAARLTLASTASMTLMDVPGRSSSLYDRNNQRIPTIINENILVKILH
jgi:hypothetical protein